MILNFFNPSTGQRAKGKYWFSWTVLLFGFFPALFRSHWVGAVVMFLLALVTFGLSWLVDLMQPICTLDQRATLHATCCI